MLHFGVALLMISELQVGLQAKENMLSLVEGETSSFVRDIRVRELAIISQKPDRKDEVVAVAESRLEDAAWYASRAQKTTRKRVIEPGGPIVPEQVIELSQYRCRCRLTLLCGDSIATARSGRCCPDDDMRLPSGLGKFSVAKQLPAVTGMEESSDASAVYVDLLEKGSQKVIQSLLVSQNASELRGVPLAETATVDGKAVSVLSSVSAKLSAVFRQADRCESDQLHRHIDTARLSLSDPRFPNRAATRRKSFPSG